MVTPQPAKASTPTRDRPRLRALEGAPIQLWTCLNPAHRTVTWTGDVACCDTCGLTSEMTGEFAAGMFAANRDVLRHMAENAIDFLKLVRGVCRACECGSPCRDCVTDGERLREYQAVLDAVNH